MEEEKEKVLGAVSGVLNNRWRENAWWDVDRDAIGPSSLDSNTSEAGG